MYSLVLCFALMGQVSDGLPWRTEAERLEWVKAKRVQEGMIAAQARKARIARDYASGAVLIRHYPAYYGNYDGLYAAQQRVLQQQYFLNQLYYLQRQAVYSNYSYGYSYGGYGYNGYNNYGYKYRYRSY